VFPHAEKDTTAKPFALCDGLPHPLRCPFHGPHGVVPCAAGCRVVDLAPPPIELVHGVLDVCYRVVGCVVPTGLGKGDSPTRAGFAACPQPRRLFD
jgi:hypothetical protein